MSDADTYKYSEVGLQDNPSNKRTELVRQHSDHLLSYYESSIPNEAAHYPRSESPSPNKRVSAYHHTRRISGDSSSSAYSNNEADENDTRGTGSETSTSVTKRLGTPSKGGADRRRLAIVQLDSSTDRPQLQHPSDTTTSTIGSIRERRGYKNDLTGLALIAPPDAASHTYTHLTPPSTAPLTGDMMSRGLKTVVQDKTHHRSASDIAQSASSRPTMDATKKLLRTWRSQNKGVNIEKGTGLPTSPSEPSQSTTPKPADQAHSPSSPYNYLTLNLADFGSPIGTPQIGEAKDIHVPVAAPIVMNLENATQPRTTLFTPRAESPASSTVCGHGQSGMISQTTIDENKTSDATPRPSRLHSPVPPRMSVDSDTGQGRETRNYGVAALRPAKMNEVNDARIHDSSVGQTKGFAHRREAANATKEQDNVTYLHVSQDAPQIPESNDLTLEEITPSRPSGSVESMSPRYRILPPTPVPKPPTSEAAQKAKDASPSKLDHTKFDQWLKENPQFSIRDSRGTASLDEPRRHCLDRPSSRLSVDHLTTEPPEPPLKGLRRSLTSTVKRFSSISRTASLSSKSAASRSSQETRRSSRTPSPLANYHPRTPSLSTQKLVSMNPAALFCHEIGGQTTALQRCTIYANKINELSMYDCGLSDWVIQMKDQSPTTQRPRGPSSRFVPQARQTSRSSIMSEATFPRRLDATTATDLSPRQSDDVSSPGLPQLPYPSLALRTVPARSNTSSSSITPPTSLRSLTPSSFSTSGFFAALGRKTSMSKRDRIVLSTRISSPGIVPSGARLPAAKSIQSINPRPIQITSPPTIPGGPRAPPSRSKRSHQTYINLASPSSATASGREDIVGQPPSLNDRLTLDNVIDIKPDPRFTEQVDKLAALIPQADRNILAGYLRRAGSDMLAIGQYLEDERMGVVRPH